MSADRKRRISITAPVLAVSRVSPACLIRWHDLGTALRFVAGLEAPAGGDGGPAGSVPAIWGLREFDAFLLLVDGVPYGGAFNPALTALDLTNVERIEVLRGPAPVNYGATSFVGVINVIHYTAGESPNRLQAGGGSYGTALASGEFTVSGSRHVGNGDVRLNEPGGAPDGYLRYADDALAATFTIPGGIDAATPTAAVFAIDNRDFAGLRLDADPSSPVDFASGVWTGYENARGVAGDEGGVDCSGKPFVADDPDANSPADTATCSAAEAPAPPPPAPNPPPSSGGGGGGAAGTGFFVLTLIAIRRRLRRVPVVRI